MRAELLILSILQITVGIIYVWSQRWRQHICATMPRFVTHMQSVLCLSTTFEILYFIYKTYALLRHIYNTPVLQWPYGWLPLFQRGCSRDYAAQKLSAYKGHSLPAWYGYYLDAFRESVSLYRQPEILIGYSYTVPVKTFVQNKYVKHST